MADSVNYITPGGFRKLQEEFTQLFNGERPKLVETVAWAAGNGDGVKTATTFTGKRRLREIYKRSKFLRDRIESARVIDPATLSGDKVVFGATVTSGPKTTRKKPTRSLARTRSNPGKTASRGARRWPPR